MIKKITYENKVSIQNDENVANKNKVTDSDMNQIKDAINSNADEQTTMKSSIETIQTEQTTQNNKITSLETDNTTNKEDITEIKEKDTEQDTQLLKLESEKEELKAENERLREDLKGLPKGTFSGESIDLNDSAEMRLQSLEIGGNSRQKTREGYNKLNINIATNTTNNVVMTNNNDGSYTFSGTANAAYFKLLASNINITENCVGSGTGTLNNATLAVQFRKNGASSDTYANLQGANFGAGDVIKQIYVQASANAVISGTIYPMINAGTTIKDFEEFGASPSPNYPSEVESCGDNINLADLSKFEDNHTINTTGEVISYNGRIATTNPIDVKDKKEAIISYSTTKSVSFIYALFKDNTLIKREVGLINKTVIDTSTGNKLYVSLYDCNKSDIDWIKIEPGSTPTLYSKYGQGNINFEMCNKNFLEFNISNNNAIKTLNKDGTLTVENEGSVTNVTFKDLTGKILAGTYTFSNLQGLNAYVMFNSSDYTHLVAVNNKYTFNYDGQSYLKIIYSNQAANTTVTYKAQLEKGTQTTDYEPHKSQIYTIPTQKSFRKIDTYKYAFIRKNGKWHERHYIERKILDGTENWTTRVSSVGRLFETVVSKSGLQTTDESNKCLSNQFVGNMQLTNNYEIRIINVTITIHNDDFETIEEFKTFLQDQYNAGTPVYIDYVLETPEDIECTEEQNQILDKIENEAKTYKNITHIFSNDNVSPILEGTYNKDIEAMINNISKGVVSNV